MCCFNYVEKLQKQFQEKMALVILNSFVFREKKISKIHPDTMNLNYLMKSNIMMMV